MLIPISHTLSSKNFVLRIPNKKDIPAIFSATRHSGFNDGMAWDPPETIEELYEPLENNIKAWKDGSGYSFSIDNKIDNAFLGRVSIRKTKEIDIWNVGFWIHPNMQKKGIMTEVLAEILAFGFQILQAKKIEAHYAIWNKASERVMVKNGFSFEEYIEKGMLKNGKWEAENKMSIDYDNWKNLIFDDKTL